MGSSRKQLAGWVQRTPETGATLATQLYQWALPLLCTVLFYGLAGGLWKQATLSAGEFCLLLVAVKLLLNPAWWACSGAPRPRMNAFLAWSLLGQVGNGVAWICYFKAFETGPAALVQTITSAYTALTALLAVLFLKERLVGIQMLGIALVLLAGALLSSGATGGGSGAWLAFSLGTLLSWGVATAIFKHAYAQEGANDAVFFLVNLAGMGLTLVPFGLSQGGFPKALGLGLVVVFLYALGDLALFAAIARGPAAIVSPLSGLYPVPTLIYSALLLHEVISPRQWVATALLLAAIVMVVPAAENPFLRRSQST